MALITQIALGLGAVFGSMVTLWAVSVKLRDASIVDVWWGAAFVVLAWTLAIAGWPVTDTAWVAVAMVSIWGLRLTWHIGRRKRGAPEDHRYAAFRAAGGEGWWLRSLFTVFLLQGALVCIVAAPVWSILLDPAPNLGVWTAVGVGVWLIGFLFESVGDAQLVRFKANPANRGKVMDAGLWKYTRHPNYFGDALLWWGIGLVGLESAWGLYALAGPLIMTFLLRRVSGVTLLESHLSSTRVGYADYVRSTNAFIPWFPNRK